MGADGLVIPWVPNPKKIFRTIKLMEGSDGPLSMVRQYGLASTVVTEMPRRRNASPILAASCRPRSDRFRSRAQFPGERARGSLRGSAVPWRMRTKVPPCYRAAQASPSATASLAPRTATKQDRTITARLLRAWDRRVAEQ